MLAGLPLKKNTSRSGGKKILRAGVINMMKPYFLVIRQLS
jgi:hypothetical protein